MKLGFTVRSYWSSTCSTSRPLSVMSLRTRLASRVSSSTLTKIMRSYRFRSSAHCMALNQHTLRRRHVQKTSRDMSRSQHEVSPAGSITPAYMSPLGSLMVNGSSH